MASESGGTSNGRGNLKIVTEDDGTMVVVMDKAALMALIRKYFNLHMVDLPMGFILQIELGEWNKRIQNERSIN